MLYLSISVLIVIFSIYAFKINRISSPFSKGVILAFFFSIMAVVCLAQNYIVSLIPGASDGIAVSNQIARWIIGEDGWSQNKFAEMFSFSIYFTLFIIILYPVILMTESKLCQKAAAQKRHS